jgi:hypothetical protein
MFGGAFSAFPLFGQPAVVAPEPDSTPSDDSKASSIDALATPEVAKPPAQKAQTRPKLPATAVKPKPQPAKQQPDVQHPERVAPALTEQEGQSVAQHRARPQSAPATSSRRDEPQVLIPGLKEAVQDGDFSIVRRFK